jgi:hypothetical protein
VRGEHIAFMRNRQVSRPTWPHPQPQASLAPWSARQDRQRRDIVLVQGPAGSGKSLFAWSLYSRFGQCTLVRSKVSHLLADAKTAPKHAVIPVFISLPKFADLLHEPSRRRQLMLEVFTELLIDCPSLLLFANECFLFIFDGLDELGLRDFNLFDDCNLQPWASHSVFVVTSRLGFLSRPVLCHTASGLACACAARLIDRWIG